LNVAITVVDILYVVSKNDDDDDDDDDNKHFVFDKSKILYTKL
jgi:hypothetical protein